MGESKPDIQTLLTKLKTGDLETRDSAIAEFHEVPQSELTPQILEQLEDAYESESDNFLKAGLGRFIKLRKQALGLR